MFGIGRFLSGRDMDGVKPTDATFWQPAIRILPNQETSRSWWEHRDATLQTRHTGGIGAASPKGCWLARAES
ncbi:hypothetical protein ACWCQQ_28985 [Streptomyces sp. NPDC002143]